MSVLRKMTTGSTDGPASAWRASNTRIMFSDPVRIAAIREPSGDHTGKANVASAVVARTTDRPVASMSDSEPSLPTTAIDPEEANGPPGSIVLVGAAGEKDGADGELDAADETDDADGPTMATEADAPVDGPGEAAPGPVSIGTIHTAPATSTTTTAIAAITTGAPGVGRRGGTETRAVSSSGVGVGVDDSGGVGVGDSDGPGSIS